MKKLVIYIHGKGGSAEEAIHYKPLFTGYDVIGFDYKAQTPWDAKEEFSDFFESITPKYETVFVIANSIGAFFTMNSLWDKRIDKAFLISPIVNMDKLISNMMIWANVTEDELCDKKEIPTEFGETLSWEYLCYVREYPIVWDVPTCILYGEKDNLTSSETISKFANRIGAVLTVMNDGEHWFYTEEQMDFIDGWLSEKINEI